MRKNDISSTAYYGAINKRFERRAAFLRKAGFKYERLAEHDIALFTKRRLGRDKKLSIAASFVLCADNRLWRDEIARFRFGVI